MSAILLGELAVIVVAAVPVGIVIGQGLAALLVWATSSELYRFPLLDHGRGRDCSRSRSSLVSAAISGLIVRRRVDQLDLVAVLKVRE